VLIVRAAALCISIFPDQILFCAIGLNPFDLKTVVQQGKADSVDDFDVLWFFIMWSFGAEENMRTWGPVAWHVYA
jgi:hypothetical protein